MAWIPLLVLGVGFLGAGCGSAAAQSAAQQPRSSGTAGMEGAQTLPDQMRPGQGILQWASAGCPAMLRATQQPGSGWLEARDGKAGQSKGANGPAQHLRLTVEAGKGLVSATVTAEGFTRHGRVVRSTLGPAQGDRTLRVTVFFKPQPDQTLAADLELPGFTAITGLRLEEAVYTDGETWQPAAGTSCRVTPDSKLLLGGR